MSAKLTNKTLARLLTLGIGTTLKVAIYNGGTISADANFVADVDGTEIATTTGYTNGFAGRLSLANVTITEDDALDRALIDCDDLVVASLGVPAGVACTKAVVYIPITNDAASVVVGQYDLNGGSTVTLDGSAVTISIHANGLAVLS